MVKTFKRETAWAILAFQGGLMIYAMMGATPDLVTARAAVATATALPAILFAVSAFGMDWAGKQTSLLGPTPAPRSKKKAPQDFPPPGFADEGN